MIHSSLIAVEISFQRTIGGARVDDYFTLKSKPSL
jgi:hypothetical protein